MTEPSCLGVSSSFRMKNREPGSSERSRVRSPTPTARSALYMRYFQRLVGVGGDSQLLKKFMGGGVKRADE